MAAAEPARLAAETAREEALALLQRGEFAGALARYESALEAARETGDAPFVDWIYACRAAAVVEAGSADDVLVELKRILLRSTDPQTSFRAAYTAARVYELRRDFKKALFYNRIARQHAGGLGDTFLRAAAGKQGGTLLVVESRFEEAADAYREALELSAAASIAAPAAFLAQLKDELGYCLISLDRLPEGLALVHEALGAFEAEDAKAFTVFPLLDLCFGYLKSDRYADARYFGEAGLERVPLGGEPALEKSFLYLLGETCHLSGDAASAQTYFDRLAAHYPEFRNLRAYLEVFDFRNVINLRS